jgi:hypothetical protein
LIALIKIYSKRDNSGNPNDNQVPSGTFLCPGSENMRNKSNKGNAFVHWVQA